MLRTVTMAALALAALPALAQTGPAHLRPTRDVAVTYRMEGGSPQQPKEMRMAWDVSTERQRIEAPGAPGWMLIDRKANTAVMVMDAQRMLMQIPSSAAAAMMQDPPADTVFTPRGTDRIAGTACNLWETTITAGKSTVCLTEDGVMLRAVTELSARPGLPQGGTMRMEATELRYGTVDPSHFTLPEGYQTMQAPPPNQPGGQPPAR
ncbi:DUF4412 domain-containing protein [Roseomonas sp. SSH11]|uniref:DUF4412 domain-containing protein n=1 Tax=Pararoseomonas baculiformis TaxID=2820812 RepID=A0ABS4AGZ1_9PROT|nr:DUF4412 domain-containing protein [Pararoseomonas baculiformis]MBP0446295.1 DUF4412 domain-containing protein [Pararoseomonas baculiformis]